MASRIVMRAKEAAVLSKAVAAFVGGQTIEQVIDVFAPMLPVVRRKNSKAKSNEKLFHDKVGSFVAWTENPDNDSSQLPLYQSVASVVKQHFGDLVLVDSTVALDAEIAELLASIKDTEAKQAE